MSETEAKKKNLGRGLNALLGDDGEEFEPVDRNKTPRSIPIDAVEPSRVQPRRIFDKNELDSLSKSVREKGILQPLLVRQHPDDSTRYELVAGERRWLAAQAAQLHEVPVVVRDIDDSDALEIAIIENIQRQDLTPLEEAEGYQRLIDEFKHTQDALAKIVGKSRSHVANMLRLLSLPDGVKTLVDGGELSAGHARALVNAPDAEAIAKEVVANGLNVRETERLVQGNKAPAGDGSAQSDKGAGARKSKGDGAASGDGSVVAEVDKTADTLALENELSNLLGLKVEITSKGEGGSLVIKYQTLEQLDDVLQRLSRGSV